MITIDPADLAALVLMLEREHFGYNDRGAAALRAYRGLERAVADDAAAIVISATNQPTTKPKD